jgi:hypothetical protein
MKLLFHLKKAYDSAACCPQPKLSESQINLYPLPCLETCLSFLQLNEVDKLAELNDLRSYLIEYYNRSHQEH